MCRHVERPLLHSRQHVRDASILGREHVGVSAWRAGTGWRRDPRKQAPRRGPQPPRRRSQRMGRDLRAGGPIALRALVLGQALCLPAGAVAVRTGALHPARARAVSGTASEFRATRRTARLRKKCTQLPGVVTTGVAGSSATARIRIPRASGIRSGQCTLLASAAWHEACSYQRRRSGRAGPASTLRSGQDVDGDAGARPLRPR